MAHIHAEFCGDGCNSVGRSKGTLIPSSLNLRFSLEFRVWGLGFGVRGLGCRVSSILTPKSYTLIVRIPTIKPPKMVAVIPPLKLPKP